MNRRPALRKATLTIHLVASVGWIGTVIGYLAFAIAAVTSNSDQTVRSAWIAMELLGWFVIVPIALAAFLTGVILSSVTRWGLLQHWWVLISLVLTGVCAAVLVLHMPDVSTLADIARTAQGDQLRTLGGDLAHPAIGLVLLLVIQVLNVYKPRGLTGRGQRLQLRSAQRGGSRTLRTIKDVSSSSIDQSAPSPDER